MKEQKRNASRRLLSLSSWEVVLLVLLTVTVLGVALRAPVKSFPQLTMQSRALNDPYDLRADRVVSESRPRVETGL